MKRLKLLGTIFGITLVNVVVLSPGLLGVKIGGESAIQTAFGVTLLIASIFVLLYVIYDLFFRQMTIKEMKTKEDYAVALSRFLDIKVLKGDISFTLEQIKRMKKKKETLFNVLNQQFDPNELSYGKFTSVISEVEKLFYLNIKNILNKISFFDESEYKNIVEQDSSRFSKEVLREKTELYNEYMTFVKNSINVNEEILLDMDKLLLEISRLESFEMEDIENMSAMKEMDALIKQTKYYKH